MSRESLPDFSGKCLCLSLEDDRSQDLISPHFELQGGRLFLIGEVPSGASRSNWAAGTYGAVAWEKVSNYVVFSNLVAYEKAVKLSDDYEIATISDSPC